MAIDIRDGKCVRLMQGDYDQETLYNDSPLKVAKAWEEQGGNFIHLVNLDGAKAGYPVNDAIIGAIAANANVPIQVGGGSAALRMWKNCSDLVLVASLSVQQQLTIMLLPKRYWLNTVIKWPLVLMREMVMLRHMAG